MRRNVTGLVFALVALFATGAVDAQAQFAGRWALELGQWQAEGGGDVAIRGPNAGVLELTMSGDSARGTYAAQGGAPPLELGGKVVGEKLTVSGKRQMRRNINGAESTVDVTISFELTVAEGEVGGVMRLATADEPSVWRSVMGKPSS